MKETPYVTHSDVHELPEVYVFNTPAVIEAPGLRACVRLGAFPTDDGARIPVYVPDTTVVEHLMTPLEISDYHRDLADARRYEHQPWYRKMILESMLPLPPLFTTAEDAALYIELSEKLIEISSENPDASAAARLAYAVVDAQLSTLLSHAVSA